MTKLSGVTPQQSVALVLGFIDDWSREKNPALGVGVWLKNRNVTLGIVIVLAATAIGASALHFIPADAGISFAIGAAVAALLTRN
ncbi:MAG: hypothetical protein WCD27_08620 [Candidatus Acidiferrales bacterium]